ncbi:MAG: ATP-binding cassette domain-containing protein [Pseudomonadota bacterium]|nr:ATP-binding cassette domain-containing protein [Pseudomonadota bacterium]
MQDRQAEGSAGATLLGLYRMLSAERRRRLLLVLLAMLGGAVAELATIGAVLPFLALIADPARAPELPGFALFLALVGGGSGEALVYKATALLIGAAVAAAAMRLVVLRLMQQFVLMVAHDIGTGIFARMLRQPYSLYVSRNSSELLSSVEKLQMLVSSVLMPLVHGAVAAVMATAIAALLFAIDAGMAAAAAGTVGLLYVAITAAAHRRLKANSVRLAGASTARIKTLQEGLGSIRDVLLDGSQPVFEESFRRLDLSFRRAQALTWFLAAVPRYLIEAAGVVLIGLLALYMSAQPGGLVAALPLLGALALGAQRLIPLVQIVYTAVAQFAGNLQMLREMLALLRTPVLATPPPEEIPPVPFGREIAFERVSFRFEGRREWALRDVSLIIPKGARIGVVGATGSGKSTFFDLLMALLEPTEGEIRIDGRPLTDALRAGWQRRIAHVPQSIYLTDSSIASNIAFGEPEGKIDLARVREAARRAQIDAFVAGLPNGYETPVGERGVRLSGGQRQRIALARALYKGASVLILDEATSALDEETEAAVMAAISAEQPDITMLIAAHRPSALALCERILRFERGRLAEDRAAPALPVRTGSAG